MSTWRNVVPFALLATVVPQAAAQAPSKSAQQAVRAPVAQAWIDVATYSGFGMGPMGTGGSAAAQGGMAGMMGALMGGSRTGENDFGRTQSAMAGRWVDVTLHTRRNPGLAEATQSVPEGTRLAPTLRLQAPLQAKPAPGAEDDTEPMEHERPKGRLYLYWGCSETVRAGQPKVLDMASASPQELAQFFQSRRATQRGAHSAAGRPVWPSRDDRRLVPEDASLAGEHAFSGQGVPDGFRFTLPAAQDLMPPIELAQTDHGGATLLEWRPIPRARAYFVSAMGSRGENEMVLWTSSELPDTGFGLLDYQTNPAVDRWLREKVLLDPGVTRCAVPKGILGESGMLRAIAYGTELDLAHPPRPADPKIPWEPQWAVKVRVKSVSTTLLGMDTAPGTGRSRGGTAPRDPSAAPARAPEPATAGGQEEKKDESIRINPVDVLRGILGR